MFMVNVRLVDKNENSHVGRVKVMKVMIQIKMLGTMVKMPSSNPPNMLRLERAAGVAASVVLAMEVMFCTILATLLAADDGDRLAAKVSIASVPSMLHVG